MKGVGEFYSPYFLTMLNIIEDTFTFILTFLSSSWFFPIYGLLALTGSINLTYYILRGRK